MASEMTYDQDRPARHSNRWADNSRVARSHIELGVVLGFVFSPQPSRRVLYVDQRKEEKQDKRASPRGRYEDARVGNKMSETNCFARQTRSPSTLRISSRVVPSQASNRYRFHLCEHAISTEVARNLDLDPKHRTKANGRYLDVGETKIRQTRWRGTMPEKCRRRVD